MKKVQKKIWYILGSLICLVLIYKCFISGHSVPILGDAAISEYRTVELGDPETPYIVPYQKEWEKYFTVVNWDQRGSGRSYHAAIGRDSLNTEQICADAVELTEYLREEFCVDKIYLVGHSYGTYVGMKCIRMKPEYYYAYDQADFGSKISLSRKWTTYYGGAIFDRNSVNFLFAEAVIRPEYSLMNLIDYLKGEELYYSNTEKDTARWELFHANLHEEVPSVEVPVYFIQGKNDYITSYEACERYFDEMQAPFKELIPLSECAHNPIIEKTDEVSRVLIDKVLLEK